MKAQEHKTEAYCSLNDRQTLLVPLDVATRLKVSVKTIHKLVREGKLSCVQVTGRERRFTDEQVQEYIRSRTIPSRVDKKPHGPVSSRPRKGGEKSFGDIGVDLREEMKQWR
jgi:excisionase family DNA binding protein